MRSYGVVLVSAAAFLLSGCMVGPRYVKPTVPVTPNFEETEELKDGDGWKVAQPDDDLIRGKWWVLYGDATLNEGEEQGDSSNEDLNTAAGKPPKLEILPASPTFEIPLTSLISHPA